MKSSTHLTLETLTHGLRFRARTGKGFDLTLDSGADRVTVDPIETTLTALGACHAMDVISILRKKREDVTGYEVQVNAERREEHPRAFTAIEIVHRVHGRSVKPASVEEAVRLSEEKYCSVHHSLNPGIRFSNRFEVLEETTGVT